MSTVDDFVYDPDQLIEVVREVIDHLNEKNLEANKEIYNVRTQLSELSKMISNLENRKIPIPDVVRTEKINLSLKLSKLEESRGYTLEKFIEELRKIVGRYGPVPPKNKPSNPVGGRRREPGKTTSREILRDLIIEALQDFGGRASIGDVHEYIRQKLEGKFLPGDLEIGSRGVVWETNVDWERHSLVINGTIKKGSPHGIWELNEGYR